MLYYISLYEMNHRPYILEFYIIDFFFSLSLTLPFIYILSFYSFATQNKIGFSFFLSKKDFSCYNDMTNISRLFLYIQIMRNDELVISSYYGLVFFFLNRTLKKLTSHTLSIAIIIISNQIINGIFIQPYRIICFCFDLTDKKE